MTSKPLSAPRPKLLSNVQALRAVAALLVVCQHLGNPGSGIEAHYFPGQQPVLSAFANFGLFGVDVFFVISGFIIYTTSEKGFAAPGASLDFLRRRLIRIYPPYWLVLFPLTLVYLMARNRLEGFHPVHVNLVASYLLLPQAGHPLVAVSWTLVYEMYFYLVFAALMIAPISFVMPAIAGWFALELSLWAVFGNAKSTVPAFFGNPIAAEFLFGILVGILYRKRMFPAPRLAFTLAALACAALWIASGMLGDMPGIERVFVWGIPAAALVYGSVGLEVAAGVMAPIYAVKMGDSSYSLYLWHLPVLIALAQLIGHHIHTPLLHAAAVVGMLGIVLSFSWVIYRYIERPMTNFLNRYGIRSQAVTSCGQVLPRSAEHGILPR